MILKSGIFLAVAFSITGNRVYQLGEMSEIRCSPERQVQSIQWLDESSGVVRQGTAVQELVLNLTIAASHNNSMYTCNVTEGTFMGSRIITIATGCKIPFSFCSCQVCYNL